MILAILVTDREASSAAQLRNLARENATDNLAVFLDHVGDGVTVQDPSGRLVYVNTAAAQTLGFASAAEFLAAPAGEVLGRLEQRAEESSRCDGGG